MKTQYNRIALIPFHCVDCLDKIIQAESEGRVNGRCTIDNQVTREKT